MIFAVILVLIGLVGAVLPALPGPPISWLGLWLAFYVCSPAISLSELLWMLALTIVVTVLDYVAPAMLTKIGGGSKASTTGAAVGTVVGLFFAPVGLILGPLVGAFVGEWIALQRQPRTDGPIGANLGQALRVALLSFVGFLLTTGAKLIISVWMAYLVIAALPIWS